MEPSKNDESLAAHLIKNLKKNEHQFSKTNFFIKNNSNSHSRVNSITMNQQNRSFSPTRIKFEKESHSSIRNSFD